MKNNMVLAGIIMVLGLMFVGCPVNDTPVIPQLTGTVTVDGDPVVGQMLTANITALGGTGTPLFQWERGTAFDFAPIVGAAGAGYVVRNDDVGYTIRVVVTRAGYTGQIISTPTAVVSDSDPGLPALTGTVTITGDAVVGQTLTADITALGGTGTASFRWESGIAPTFTAITGATGATYVVQAADVNQTIRVVVTRTGYSGEVIGGPTAAVTDPSLPTLSGTVTITGNPVVGEQLTANTTLTGVSFRWERGIAPNFTAITGATDTTYTVQAADLNQTIRVVVTRTGYSGEVISTPTAAVTDTSLPTLTGTVSITGNPVVGELLTANTTLAGVSFRWERGIAPNFTAITGATSATYTVHEDDVGQTIRVVVTRTGYSGEVISTPTAAVTDTSLPTLTGTVSITGNPVVGEQLTANTTLTGVSFRWERGIAPNFTAITGATSATYTVQAADLNQTIRVVVTRTGYLGEVISTPTPTVTDPSLPQLTGTVTIGGDALMGQTLTANITALAGTGTPTFRWERGTGTNFIPIPGATNATYLVQMADVDLTIRVVVSRVGYTGEAIGGPTTTVTDPRPPLTGTVTIDGDALVGRTLTANTSALLGSGAFSFRWERGIAPNFNTITGETSASYVVRIADVGQTIRVVVTRADNSHNIPSAPTAVVAVPVLTGTVTIDGEAVVGRTLTANISALDGTGTASFQWHRHGPSGSTQITNATGQNHVLQPIDAGHAISVTVTRTGYTGSVTSPQTGTVITSGGDFSISFTPGIEMEYTSLSISILASQTNPQRITVLNPEQFDGDIRWFRGHSEVWWMVEGDWQETLVLGSQFHENRTGIRPVTVEVQINGVLHSKVIYITVMP